MIQGVRFSSSAVCHFSWLACKQMQRLAGLHAPSQLAVLQKHTQHTNRHTGAGVITFDANHLCSCGKIHIQWRLNGNCLFVQPPISPTNCPLVRPLIRVRVILLVRVRVRGVRTNGQFVATVREIHRGQHQVHQCVR